MVLTYSLVVVVLPTPSEGWERGGTPRRPNSRATPQGLDQGPEKLLCGNYRIFVIRNFLRLVFYACRISHYPK